MTEDYKQSVLDSYLECKKNYLLSPNLQNPTPGKLQTECIRVITKRFLKKDEEMLKLFFDPLNQSNDLIRSINNYELSKFKPLISFIKQEKKTRNEENIKLLAWLIDFEPRPYVFEPPISNPVVIKEVPEKEEKKQDTKKEPVIVSEDQPIIVEPTPWFKKPLAYASAIVLSLLLIAPIAYKFTGSDELAKIASANEAIIQNEKKQMPVKYVKSTVVSPSNTKPSAKAKKGCMYWAGDHYEAIDCNKEIGDTAKFVINAEKVAKFKKINTPDTLTKNSVGIVYYLKMNNKMEYFTDEGFHPIYTERKLKKLSLHMLKEHVLNKR